MSAYGEGADGDETDARQRWALGSITLGRTLWNLLETFVCSHDCNEIYDRSRPRRSRSSGSRRSGSGASAAR